MFLLSDYQNVENRQLRRATVYYGEVLGLLRRSPILSLNFLAELFKTFIRLYELSHNIVNILHNRLDLDPILMFHTNAFNKNNCNLHHDICPF